MTIKINIANPRFYLCYICVYCLLFVVLNLYKFEKLRFGERLYDLLLIFTSNKTTTFFVWNLHNFEDIILYINQLIVLYCFVLSIEKK